MKNTTLTHQQELANNEGLAELSRLMAKLDMKAAAKERLATKVANTMREDLANGAITADALFLEGLTRHKYILGIVNRLSAARLRTGKSIESFSDISTVMFLRGELSLNELEAVQTVRTEAVKQGLNLKAMAKDGGHQDPANLTKLLDILAGAGKRYRLNPKNLGHKVADVIKKQRR